MCVSPSTVTARGFPSSKARNSSDVKAAIAAAASGVFLPNFFPSARKFGLALRVTSASPDFANATCLTLSSAESNGTSWRSRAWSTAGATQTARSSG